MSSHCSRYPTCGCSNSVGTKCYLPEGDSRLLEKEPDGVGSYDDWLDKKNFEDESSFDKEALEKEILESKQKEPRVITTKNPHHKYPTNYTPPKRRHRK